MEPEVGIPEVAVEPEVGIPVETAGPSVAAQWHNQDLPYPWQYDIFWAIPHPTSQWGVGGGGKGWG
jgi:hypothetical protein